MSCYWVKNLHTPPNSHHPAQNLTIQMFSAIESNISRSIQIYEIAAHKHFMAKSSNGHMFISGAGGRNHHDGGTSPEWPFLNNEEYAYLQIRTNDTDGKVISSHFYGDWMEN